MNSKIVIFGLIFPFLLLVFLLHYKIVGQAVYGDGIFYYAFTRSIYKDHDIGFKNELGHHYSPTNNNAPVEEKLAIVSDYTKTGYVVNRYPIGAPLAWLLGFAIADIYSLFLHVFSHSISLTGYSDIYQIMIGIENILFVTLGLFVLSRILGDFFSKKIVISSLLFLTGGTFLFYYSAIDVVNSLPFTFLLSTIFLTFFLKILKKHSVWNFFLLGLCIGAMTLTRTQEAVFAILPVIFLTKKVLTDVSQQKFTELRNSLYSLLLLVLGFMLMFSLQMIVWYIMYGTITHSPYIAGKEGFYFLSPHLIDLIKDRKIGLLWWSPGILLGCIGLGFFLKKEMYIGKFAVLLVAAEYYLIASWSAWQQGESFSVRMLTSSLPFIALGIGALFEYIEKIYTIKVVYALTCFFIILTFVLILYFLGIYQSPTYDLGKTTTPTGFMSILTVLRAIFSQ